MHLYEIAQDYRDVQALADNPDIPLEAIADTLQSVKADFEEKADNICVILKEEEADAVMLKTQIEALQARLKRKKSNIEFYKKYLTDQFAAVGKKVLETPRNSVSFRPSEQVIIDDRFIELNCNNPAFVKTETTQTPIKANIKQAIKNGDTVLGASIQTVENIQIK